MKNKSIYRIISMVAGILNVLPFLVLPYAKLEGMMGGLGQLAGALGMGDAYPEKLTGLNAVKMADAVMGGDAMFMAIFVVPAIMGVIILLFHVLGKGKLSYVGTILLSLVNAGCYGLITIALQDFEHAGYTSGVTVYLMLAVVAVQVIVAIAGLIMDKGQTAAKGKSKNVKVGKKDGTMTGIRGAYSGAMIPVKSGDTVVIGRDPSVCSIVLKDEKASRKHCTVTFNAENGMYAVTDCSVNGVYDKDGNRLPENVAVPMSAGSEIRIGKDGEAFRLG